MKAKIIINMIHKIKFVGFDWYVDLEKQLIAEDVNFKSYTTFNHLTKNEINFIKDYIKYNHANIEPSLTSTCKEGAETTGTDTNLSDNTSKSVQHPGYNIKFNDEPKYKSINTFGELLFQDGDIVRS